MKHLTGIFIAGFFILAACSKVTSTTSTLSCNVTSANICTDFSSGYPESAAQQYCTNANGTYSNTSACTTTGRVGSCAITSNGLTITQRYYPPNDATSSQSTCSGSSGTWTAN